jgi:hypothetical protein
MAKISEDKRARVETVSPILQTLNVLAEISEVHAKLRNSTSPKLGKELATGDSVVQVDDALKIVLDKEKTKLTTLINEYYKRDLDGSFDEIELERYRKRVATRLCKYLRSLEPISDSINDYDKLRKFFCLNSDGS